MTQEDKELLLKDLCARLPYGVKVSIDDTQWCDFCKDIPYKITLENSYRILSGVRLGFVKPYLFPLSSMNEEQIKEFNSITQKCSTYIGKSISLTDFCNKHHIDWRGFIEKGLALDATGKNIY